MLNVSNSKYETTGESKFFGTRTVWRIRATKDFSDIKAGDFGGFIECEKNLDEEGDCWIYDNSIVAHDARVYGDAKIMDASKIADSAKVYGKSIIKSSCVCDYSEIYDNAVIGPRCNVGNLSKIGGNAKISNIVTIYGNATIVGSPIIKDYVIIGGSVKIYGNGTISKSAIGGAGSFLGNYNIIKNKDYLYINNVFGPNKDITAYRSILDGIIVVYEMKKYNLQDFEKYMKKNLQNEDQLAEFKIVIELIKQKIPYIGEE